LIGSQFKERVEKENRDKFFRKNVGYFFAGLALTVAVVVGVLVFGGLREEDYFVLFFVAFAGVWLGLFLIPVIIGIFRGVTSGSVFHIALIVIAVLVFVFGFGSQMIDGFFEISETLLPYFLQAIVEHSFPFVLVGTFAAVNGLFLYLLRAPTDVGRKVMDQIEGLRLYIETAESARLNMNAPEITSDRFEALLPYAVALGLEKPWAEAFEAALKRAYPNADNPATFYRPSWSNNSNWSGSNIGNAVSSSVAAATGAFASSVPVSSSGSSGFSGGGGGSGGGSGGGGGGGW